MKVCIDPGHGMSNKRIGVYDPGAGHEENGARFEEAGIALRYGLSLKDTLRARGTDVFMTRDDAHDYAPLGSRASNAKSAGCNRYVSLHLNDAEDDKAHGLEVLYGKREHKALADKLQAALVGVTNLRDRGAKPRPELAVLKFKGPAVLVELGFIANDSDREALLNPAMRDSICRTIADIITT